MERLLAMVRKEFQQLRRDRRMLLMFTLAPVLQLVLIGFAVSNDVRDVPLAVHDGDCSQRSRELRRSLEACGYFVVHPVARAADLPLALDQRQAELALDIPAGFSRHILRGEQAPLQVLIDGSDSNSAGLAGQYLVAVLRRAAPGLIGIEAPAGIDAQPRVWFNPQLLSVYYMVPAVLALVLMTITMIATSLSIVREREVGTLEQIIVTPLRPWELLAGKMIPVALLAFADSLLIVAVIHWGFRVPLLGSAPLLMACVALLLLNTLGTGLLISAISRTQQQAQLTAFLLLNPAILLSGFMFPVENMPRFFQDLTCLIAVRHFLTAERGLFLRGAGLPEVLPHMLWMLALGVATFAAGALRFRKQLD